MNKVSTRKVPNVSIAVGDIIVFFPDVLSIVTRIRVHGKRLDGSGLMTFECHNGMTCTDITSGNSYVFWTGATLTGTR